jgi:NAD(P)-dependent dehydrogenase (short-subunit alcohol dehydrogenase family)
MSSQQPQQRVAVITGAAQGIGAQIAEVLAADGFTTAVIDLQPVAVPDGVAGFAAVGDITSEADVTGFADEVLARYGRIDVVVNNAGIACITPFEDMSLAAWRQVLDVNLTGPFLISRAFGRMMLAQPDTQRSRRGSFVKIASVAGLRGVADRAAYNTSKHGLIGLTRTLAAEWGGRGIRVNAVCPGCRPVVLRLVSSHARPAEGPAPAESQAPKRRLSFAGSVHAGADFASTSQDVLWRELGGRE